jgi:hypothetical protein
LFRGTPWAYFDFDDGRDIAQIDDLELVGSHRYRGQPKRSGVIGCGDQKGPLYPHAGSAERIGSSRVKNPTDDGPGLGLGTCDCRKKEYR